MERKPLLEAAIVSVVVTVVVTVGAMLLPKEHSGTFVGSVFLFAVWHLLWRRTDEEVAHSGVGLGGLVLSLPLDFRRMAKETAVALAWALGFAAVIFPPFYLGWSLWWKPAAHFAIVLHPYETLNLVASQVILVALPEEAFYRGYLQTRLDDAFAPKISLFGARIGPSLVIASAVFAIGHLLTVHSVGRLAVFFPSLVFGWLRVRTKGIGAPIAFHVMCNLFTEGLGRGFGIY